LNVRNLISGAQFRRDVKLAKRRGKDMSKLRELILLLVVRDYPQGGIQLESQEPSRTLQHFLAATRLGRLAAKQVLLPPE